jgi:hypothetical protein
MSAIRQETSASSPQARDQPFEPSEPNLEVYLGLVRALSRNGSSHLEEYYLGRLVEQGLFKSIEDARKRYGQLSGEVGTTKTMVKE